MTERIVGELIKSNVFVVSNGDECVIFDAGVVPEKIVNAVGNRKVLGIFLTHGHFDHCFYVLDYAKTFGCKIYGSEFIAEYLESSERNYSREGFAVKNFSNFVFLKGNGEVDFGNIKVKHFQMGGHSKSDMVFEIDDEIFVGDVLIGRDMGRIDLYGASKDEMEKSLQALIDMDYSVIHAGHGEDKDKATQDEVARLWIRYLKRLG